jgi:3',5'-cyclic AMP phosphodiesterase CpdA
MNIQKIYIIGLVTLVCLSFAVPAQAQIAVVSDVHVMDPTLLKKDGKAFEDYVKRDRKMLKESTLLLEAFTDSLLKSSVRYLLIPGDLTKDGEKVSHQYLIDHCLSRLKQAGITVLVIPGNHDTNNPHAVAYDGEKKERVPTVSPSEFAQLYSDYGYGKAIARDTASLSYVYQLTPSLRVLALDATESANNDFVMNTCITPGRLKPATLAFIRQQLLDARREGMHVIGMMHHGLIEHWRYQNKMMPGYIIEDSKAIAAMMYHMGLRLMFTGHSHAQDISKYKGIYDIETGSLVSYPSPYRVLTLHRDTLDITTHHITSVPCDTGGKNFTDYAKSYELTGFKTFMESILPAEFPAAVRTSAIDFVSAMMVRNYAGDEKMTTPDEEQLKQIVHDIRKYSLRWSIIYSRVVHAIGNDDAPADNNITIILNK